MSECSELHGGRLCPKCLSAPCRCGSRVVKHLFCRARNGWMVLGHDALDKTLLTVLAFDFPSREAARLWIEQPLDCTA